MNYKLLLTPHYIIIEYHGFLLYRHKSNEATCIEYKSAQGDQKIIAVKDAKFRSNQIFGNYTIDSSLTNFNSQGTNGWYIIDNNPLDISTSIPATYTNEAIFQQWSASLITDKTAKENCDVWMTYQGTSDSKGTVGVPAVEWCRNQNISDNTCNLPNIYQTICIFACGDELDEMNPTLFNYPTMRIGYSSAYGNRCNRLWSSTEYNSNTIRSVRDIGNCYYSSKANTYTAIPILEI